MVCFTSILVFSRPLKHLLILISLYFSHTPTHSHRPPLSQPMVVHHWPVAAMMTTITVEIVVVSVLVGNQPPLRSKGILCLQKPKAVHLIPFECGDV